MCRQDSMAKITILKLKSALKVTEKLIANHRKTLVINFGYRKILTRFAGNKIFPCSQNYTVLINAINFVIPNNSQKGLTMQS